MQWNDENKIFMILFLGNIDVCNSDLSWKNHFCQIQMVLHDAYIKLLHLIKVKTKYIVILNWQCLEIETFLINSQYFIHFIENPIQSKWNWVNYHSFVWKT